MTTNYTASYSHAGAHNLSISILNAVKRVYNHLVIAKHPVFHDDLLNAVMPDDGDEYRLFVFNQSIRILNESNAIHVLLEDVSGGVSGDDIEVCNVMYISVASDIPF